MKLAPALYSKLLLLIVALPLFGTLFCAQAAAQFAGGDEVRLTRDVPLLFNGNKYRDGRAGEVLPVYQYRPLERRVYILQTDSSGKQFAVSVEDSALAPVSPDPYLLLYRGIAALARSDFAGANRLFEQSDLLDGGVGIATGLKTFALNLQTAAAELARAQAAEKQIQPEFERRMRNAKTADRPNLLTGGDENQVRARGMAAEAQQFAQGYKDAVEKARLEILTTLRSGQFSVESLSLAQCFAAALAMDDAIVALSKKHGFRRHPILPVSDRERFALKAAEADAAMKSAKSAQAARKLVAALGHAEAGLAAENGRGDIRRKRDELSDELAGVRSLLNEALALQEGRKFEDALAKLKSGQARCVDLDELNERVSAIEKIVAEKGK